MFGIRRTPGARTVAGGAVVTAFVGLVSAVLASPASAGTVAAHRLEQSAPPAPVLEVRSPGGPESGLVPDRTAHLTLRNVVAGSGHIRSVMLFRGDGIVQPVAVNESSTQYDITVPGLTNGRKYDFVARVCNTADRCNTSNSVTFTPYGLPKPPRVFARPGKDAQLDVAWGTADLNGYPFSISCEIRVYNLTADRAIAVGPAYPDQAGSFTLKLDDPGTYQARYRCRVGDTTVTSNSAPVPVSLR